MFEPVSAAMPRGASTAAGASASTGVSTGGLLRSCFLDCATLSDYFFFVVFDHFLGGGFLFWSRLQVSPRLISDVGNAVLGEVPRHATDYENCC